jgi:hypothetical protein
MNNTEIKELMNKRGFVLWATYGDDNLHFLSKNEDNDLVINCIIYPKTKEFEFKYVVPHSIMQLINPKCSPFTNGKHFLKMLEKFMSVVNKINEESEE